MRRTLQIAVSAFCLTLCALLIGMWMRSQRLVDLTIAPITSKDSIVLRSTPGAIWIEFLVPGWEMANWKATLPASDWPDIAQEAGWPQYSSPTWGMFAYQQRLVVLPYWFCVLLTVIGAAIPWVKWSRRFSLQALFLITTLVAVVLGLSALSG